MCGQETSLRGISLLLIADGLQSHLAPDDRTMISETLVRSVERVLPTLRYALSQRNNHAISEAGFIWGASVLIDHPQAQRWRRRAERALRQAIDDQFLPDGSYAQHSPTYHRLALQVLLWVLRVGALTGVAPPSGVREAVERSIPFLTELVAPESEGRVPNLGGNDGALLFDLSPVAITDLRPVLVHAHAAVGWPSPFPPGPWDAEAQCFGYEVVHTEARPERSSRIAVHALTRGSAHAVLRAGPLRHRPAHADQLHLDVWLSGQAVAMDAGSFRYTAPAPWGNALAEESVHNLPSRPGSPQAARAGRFFWRSWTEAEIVMAAEGEIPVRLARLTLPDGSSLHRLVAVSAERVLVIDQGDEHMMVRWNLPPGTDVAHASGRGSFVGDGWSGMALGGERWELPQPSDDDPVSGWHSPTYGVREPLRAVLIPADARHRVVTVFGVGTADQDTAVFDRCSTVDLRHVTPGVAQGLLAPEG